MGCLYSIELFHPFSAYAMTFLRGYVHVLILGSLEPGQKKVFFKKVNCVQRRFVCS